MTAIDEQLEEMRREIAELRGAVEKLSGAPVSDTAAETRFTLAEIEYFERLPPDAVVEKDYVAYRFGCSVRAVRRGERGTDKIPRVCSSPLKFVKRAVDAAWAKRKKKPLEKRAAAERKTAKKRIYSIIKK